MDLSSLSTPNLKTLVDEMILEQARRHNGATVTSDNEYVAGLADASLKIEADAARGELRRRDTTPRFRATLSN